MTRIIRDIRFGTVGNFFNCDPAKNIYFSHDLSNFTCAKLLAPSTFASASTLCRRTSSFRVRERCSRLSCIQSGLPTGCLDIFPDRGRPSRTSDRGRGEGTCPAGSGAKNDSIRLSLFVLDLQLHSVVVALDTHRGCSHLLYTHVCVCGAVYTDLRAHIRIIRDPNNSRS